MIEILSILALSVVGALFILSLFRGEKKAEETKLAPSPAFFKRGQWVCDHRTGKLGMIWMDNLQGSLNPTNEHYKVEFEDGVVDVDAVYLHLALPRAGEYWMKLLCDAHNKEAEEIAEGLWAANWRTYPRYSRWIRCGCYIPVSYGKGKTGVAKAPGVNQAV